MLNPKNLGEGYEQYETFKRNGKIYFQYDYRNFSGKLFSCVGKSLEDCRKKCDNWKALGN